MHVTYAKSDGMHLLVRLDLLVKPTPPIHNVIYYPCLWMCMIIGFKLELALLGVFCFALLKYFSQTPKLPPPIYKVTTIHVCYILALSS